MWHEFITFQHLFYLFQVEGSLVHIMKALASHPSAAQSLTEDDSLELLFQMVANGSLVIFARYKEGLVPLHSMQLHRHAMQVDGMNIFHSILQYNCSITFSNMIRSWVLIYLFWPDIAYCSRFLVFFWSMTMEVQQNIFAGIIWYVNNSTCTHAFTINTC